MSSTYYNGTGSLKLGTVTAIIQAVFGTFQLKANYPTVGYAFFSIEAESCNPTWNDIAKGLYDFAIKKSIPLDILNDGLSGCATSIAKNFNSLDTKEMQRLIEHFSSLEKANETDVSADLFLLFDFCMLCNDGHDLKHIVFNGSWYGSKIADGDFGGNALYHSPKFTLNQDTNGSSSLGNMVGQALAIGDIPEAAKHLHVQFSELVSGISNPFERVRLQKILLETLSDTWDQKRYDLMPKYQCMLDIISKAGYEILTTEDDEFMFAIDDYDSFGEVDRVSAVTAAYHDWTMSPEERINTRKQEPIC